MQENINDGIEKTDQSDDHSSPPTNNSSPLIYTGTSRAYKFDTDNQVYTSSLLDQLDFIDNQIITVDQLNKAMESCGYSPNQEYLMTVVRETNAHFKDKEMAAMFLAQLAHESGGYIHLEEESCKDCCNCQYGTGASGKSYHGRGFIQLSWPDNYKSASMDLGMDYTLYNNPELVSQYVDLAMKVSIWYWDTRVITTPGVSDKKHFGLTTKAINGVLESNDQNIEQSKHRYELYLSIAREMGITNVADEDGCYTK